MVRPAWWIVTVVLIGMVVAITSQPAAAQEPAGGEYPDVVGLTPFSAETNFMSLPGYLRWQVYLEQEVWLSLLEAKRIVAEQTGK